MKNTLENKLKDVPNTTTLVSEFVKFCAAQKNNENNVHTALKAFKEIYESASYYDDVKESVVKEVSMLGIIDAYDVDNDLS